MTMDADEVLTGKKETESVPIDALHSYIGKPISEDLLCEVFKKPPLIPSMNPKPIVKIVDMKGKDRKIRPCLELGLEFSF